MASAIERESMCVSQIEQSGSCARNVSVSASARLRPALDARLESGLWTRDSRRGPRAGWIARGCEAERGGASAVAATGAWKL